MEYLTSDLDWVLSLRGAGLRKFFKLFPCLVSETFYLLFISFGYWCWRKDIFRDMAIMLSFATLVNLMLKAFFHMPRATIDHLLHTTNYSFSSGDTQVATVFWLLLALATHRKWVWGVGFLMIIGSAFSRVYLGGLYRIDFLGGFGIGAIMLAMYHFIKESSIGEYFSQKKDLGPIAIYLVLTVYFIGMKNHLGSLILTVAGVLWGVRFIVMFVGLLGLFALRFRLKPYLLIERSLMKHFMAYGMLGFYIVFIVPWIVQKVSNWSRHERILAA